MIEKLIIRKDQIQISIFQLQVDNSSTITNNIYKKKVLVIEIMR